MLGAFRTAVTRSAPSHTHTRAPRPRRHHACVPAHGCARPRPCPRVGSARRPARTCAPRTSKEGIAPRGAARRFRGRWARWPPSVAILSRAGLCCRGEAGERWEARLGPGAAAQPGPRSRPAAPVLRAWPRAATAAAGHPVVGTGTACFVGVIHRTPGHCCRCAQSHRDHRSRSCA